MKWEQLACRVFVKKGRRGCLRSWDGIEDTINATIREPAGTVGSVSGSECTPHSRQGRGPLVHSCLCSGRERQACRGGGEGAPSPAPCCVCRVGGGSVEGADKAAWGGGGSHPSPFPPASWAREADVLLSFSPHRSALARFTCGQELGLHLSVEVTEA